MVTIGAWMNRYIEAMALIDQILDDGSTKKRLRNAFTSICYAPPEGIEYKMRVFSQVCLNEEAELNKYGICHKLKNILSGKLFEHDYEARSFCDGG
jgi:hypothetical protein